MSKVADWLSEKLKSMEGWERRELADKADVSYGTLDHLIRQKYSPKIAIVEAVLKALGFELQVVDPLWKGFNVALPKHNGTETCRVSCDKPNGVEVPKGLTPEQVREWLLEHSH